MAAFRMLLLLGLSTTVTRCAAVSSSDAETMVELMNVTYTSAVIMQSCPVATQVLLACCLLLGAAIGVRTYLLGVGFSEQPPEKVRSLAAGCCCCSCSFFCVFLFAPIFAFFVGQGSACDASVSHAAFVDKFVFFAFVAVFLMFLTFFASIHCRGAIASFLENAKKCCACCDEPNDSGMAKVLLVMIVLVCYSLVAIVLMLCWEQLDATAQRVVCLVEVLLMFCFYWICQLPSTVSWYYEEEEEESEEEESEEEEEEEEKRMS